MEKETISEQNKTLLSVIIDKGPKAYDAIKNIVDFECPSSAWKHANTNLWLIKAAERSIWLLPKGLMDLIVIDFGAFETVMGELEVFSYTTSIAEALDLDSERLIG